MTSFVLYCFAICKGRPVDRVILVVLAINYRRVVLELSDKSPTTIYTTEGSNLKLFCGDALIISESVEYNFEGQPLLVNRTNVELLNDTLSIKGFTNGNIGTYSCKIDIRSPLLPNSTFIMSSAPLMVQLLEAELTIETTKIESIFGGCLRLKVSLTGNLPTSLLYDVEWKTSEYIEQVENTTLYDINMHNQNTKLLKLTEGIIHIYWIYYAFNIKAKLDSGNVLESVWLNISPVRQASLCTLAYAQTDITVSVGKKALLECVSNETPQSIMWLFEGKELIYDQKTFKIGSTGLVLQDVSVAHAGKYTCILKCKDMSLSSSMSLVVEEKNDNDTSNGDSSYNITNIETSKSLLVIGDNFTFNVEKPVFCYYTVLKNAKTIAFNNSTRERHAQISLLNVSKNDTGLYQLMVFCSEIVFSYSIPILVEETYGQDDSLLWVEKEERPGHYNVRWKLPAFLPKLKYECINFTSNGAEDRDECINSSVGSNSSFSVKLLYETNYNISLSISEPNHMVQTLSSISFKTDPEPDVIHPEDFKIHDVSWLYEANSWIIKWKMDTSYNKRYLSYNVTCLKLDGSQIKTGLTQAESFSCGTIGVGTSKVEIYSYYNGTNVSHVTVPNNYPTLNILRLRWTKDKNYLALLFTNYKRTAIEQKLPILLILQEVECSNRCLVRGELVIKTFSKRFIIDKLNPKSYYKLFYMRSDIEQMDTNPYVYFYVPPADKFSDAGVWLFLVFLLSSVLFYIVFIVFYSLQPKSHQNSEEVLNSPEEPVDYVFNVDSMPPKWQNISPERKESRKTSKEFGLLSHPHVENCLYNVLMNSPKISFKTKLYRRCEARKQALPEYTTKKAQLGYISLVSTREVRIGSHDHYPLEIEAEQAAARNALIELKEIKHDPFLLMPEYLYKIVMPENPLFFSYKNTLHLLCLELGCQLPIYRFTPFTSGYDCQLKIGDDFSLKQSYTKKNVFLCGENLCYEALAKLHLLKATSTFNPKVSHYPLHSYVSNRSYAQFLGSYLQKRIWIFVRMKLETDISGDSIGLIQISKRQFTFHVTNSPGVFPKDYLAYKTMYYMGLTDNELDDSL